MKKNAITEKDKLVARELLESSTEAERTSKDFRWYFDGFRRMTGTARSDSGIGFLAWKMSINTPMESLGYKIKLTSDKTRKEEAKRETAAGPEIIFPTVRATPPAVPSAANPVPKPKYPPDGYMTAGVAAARMGCSRKAAVERFRVAGIAARKVPHPENDGPLVNVYPIADAERLIAEWSKREADPIFSNPRTALPRECVDHDGARRICPAIPASVCREWLARNGINPAGAYRRPGRNGTPRLYYLRADIEALVARLTNAKESPVAASPPAVTPVHAPHIDSSPPTASSHVARADLIGLLRDGTITADEFRALCK